MVARLLHERGDYFFTWSIKIWGLQKLSPIPKCNSRIQLLAQLQSLVV